MPVTIQAHYDGKVIVPHEAVDLPLNQLVHLQVVENAEENVNKDTGLLSEEERERRKIAWDEFISRAVSGPDIPLEALRRENLYEDRL